MTLEQLQLLAGSIENYQQVYTIHGVESDRKVFCIELNFVTILAIIGQFHPKLLFFSKFIDFHSLDFADIAYYGR